MTERGGEKTHWGSEGAGAEARDLCLAVFGTTEVVTQEETKSEEHPPSHPSRKSKDAARVGHPGFIHRGLDTAVQKCYMPFGPLSFYLRWREFSAACKDVTFQCEFAALTGRVENLSFAAPLRRASVRGCTFSQGCPFAFAQSCPGLFSCSPSGGLAVEENLHELSQAEGPARTRLKLRRGNASWRPLPARLKVCLGEPRWRSVARYGARLGRAGARWRGRALWARWRGRSGR
jgi:hypothetical protein